MPELMLENISVAPQVKPVCPVFGECGGCQYQNISYPDELRIKESVLKGLFQKSLSIPDDIFEPIVASPNTYHYRNRVDLRIVRTKSNEVFIGFTPESSSRVIPIETCPIALSAIADAIPAIKRQVENGLPARYRNANLVIRTGDDGQVRWGGIGRKSLLLNEPDYFWTEIAGKRIFYSLDTFFQANLSILPLVIARISALPVFKAPSVFFDLYGGVGFFGICLSSQVQEVVLIEENVHSLRLAQYNAKHHQLSGFRIIEGRVEDHLSACLQSASDKNKVAMIDPPRAGLSPQACDILSSAGDLDCLLYLSCHPETLVRDIRCFVEKGWAVTKIMPFDFFPRTRHIETLVVLKPGKDSHAD